MWFNVFFEMVVVNVIVKGLEYVFSEWVVVECDE